MKYMLSLLLMLAAFKSPAQQELTQLIDQLNVRQNTQPEFKVYVSHDKPAYVAGETIWLTAFLVDGTFHRLNALTQTIYAELLDAEGNMIIQQILNAPLGVAPSDMQLPDSLPAGNYVLRAYTNYMRNQSPDFFFHKTIPILTAEYPSTGAQSDLEGRTDLQFFPEGGTFLIGVENRVAFKAIGSDGLPIDVTGKIIDETGTAVTAFNSIHDGMGEIRLTPSPGKSYTAILENPDGGSYTLPAVEFSGYSLAITENSDHFEARIYRNTTTQAGRINIIAQSRGVVVFAAQGEITNSSIVRIPKSNLPTGITQVTVFDEEGKPRCERLIFINQEDMMKISLSTDRSVYAEREKVSLQVHGLDPGSDSLDAVMSVTVYDLNKVPATEESPLDIVSYLYLCSDLKGHVNNPGYYFSETSSEVKANADLLMLTQGWRRFAWDELSSAADPSVYRHERGIPIRGSIKRAMSKKGVESGQIKILDVNSGRLALTEADEEGNFFNDDLVFYDSAELVIQTESRKGNRSEYDLTTRLPFPDVPLSYSSPSYYYSNPALLDQARNRLRIEEGYTTDEDVIMLEEVSVTATRAKQKVERLFGTPDRTITTESFPKSAVNILDLLRGRFAGVQISGNPLDPTVSIRGGGEPLFILDGIQVPKSAILILPPDVVGQIDLIKGNEAAIYGSNGSNGVLAFYTKVGYQGGGYPNLGMNTQWYPGYHTPREFYSPRYDVPADRHNLPDERTTLYWNPVVRLSGDGKADLDFFTADESSSYLIKVEGITLGGNPGISTAIINVDNERPE